MPLPFTLIPEAAPCAGSPSARAVRPLRASRMFPSSTIASTLALVLYAALAVLLPRLTPSAEPIIVQLEPHAPVSPLAPPGIEPPPASPRQPDAASAETFRAEPIEPVPVTDGIIAPSAVAIDDVTPPPGAGQDARGEARARDDRNATPGALPGAGAQHAIAPYYEEPPVTVEERRPDYPQIAIDAGVSGTVMLRVLVGVDGRVEDVRVLKSVPLLDEAAVEAARRWVFRPARVSGRPVRVWVALPVRFSLR